MSTFYKKSNSESVGRLYNKNLVYKKKIITEDNVVNFNLGERFLFGRARRDSTPIVVNEGVLKPITQSDGQDSPLAVNFVVDVFSQMALQFQKCTQLGKIDPNDPFLSNLVAYRAYQSPIGLYEQYRDGVFKAIENLFRAENVKISNFSQFLELFKITIKQVTKQMRVTFPGYVKSRFCPPLCSGLAIEIASNQSFIDDESKINTFYNSPNWDFYVNTCNSYGFMIDYKIPWRIIADIDSESMNRAAINYGFFDTNQILSNAYSSAVTKYWLDAFSVDLYNLYNLLRLDYWTETEVCKSGKVIQREMSSKRYSYEQIIETYGYREFLALFLLFRAQEERPEMDEFERDRMIKDILKIYDENGGLSKAISVFEKIINKEFDKVGSFTYIRDSVIEKREESFKQGKIDSVTVED